MYKIPIYQPTLGGNEKQYVNEALDTNWISSKGEFVSKFENQFSNYLSVNYSTSVCNGTVALHLALLALGIGPGDEVLVPTLTYIASVNAITYVGAKPVFVDSEPIYYQMDPNDIQKKIGSNTKAIMAVHLYGHPCNMEAITKICDENGLYLIEDCAEAVGSKYKDKYVGTFGNIATFSFFGNKTITCGEGGMVVTNDKTLFERSVHFKGQGLAKERQYWHDVIGYNYRMTNIAAAIGLGQLEQIEKFIERKRQIAHYYIENLKELPLEVQPEADNCLHTYWMVNVILKSGINRELIRQKIESKGIETRPMFYPVHTMPMYSRQFEINSISEDLGWRGLNLPSWPGLEDEALEFIVKTVRESLIE